MTKNAIVKKSKMTVVRLISGRHESPDMGDNVARTTNA